MKRFEINCDLGESMGNDHKLMPLIDACSVACGGHIGDEQSMRGIVRLAKRHFVKVGAHPSFPDKEGFGRQVFEITPADLQKSLEVQVRSLEIICKAEDIQLDYIKPHGALYNQAVKDVTTAKTIITVMKSFPELKLYAPWKSVIAKLASQENIPVMHEAFADRKYNKDLSLVSRSEPNAIIQEPVSAAEQAYIILTESQVITSKWERVEIKADTICVHGDNPAAVDILKRLNQLKEAKLK